MAEPSITLTNLRRMICRELKMPFFLRYKNGFLDADSGTTTTLVDTALTQKDKFWNNAWVYRVASQDAALILNFTSADDTLTLETPVTTFASGDDYEIHSLWNAYEIHEAINQAIRDVRRVFIETITDELLVVQEDKLSYSLADLSRDPFVISQVWLEQPTSVARGTVVSATATTVTLPAGYLPSALGTDTWYISIYDGTGKGGLRALTALTVGGVQASVATWDTNPDSTSKFALWKGSEETNDWYAWNAIRYDSSKEFPDVLYFSVRPTDFLGMRIRVEYVSLPVELTLEADTTKIPTSYLLPAVVSKLHGHKIGDNRADRDLHFGEARRYQDMADAFLARNAPHRPDMSMLRHPSNSYQPDPMNPLNW